MPSNITHNIDDLESFLVILKSTLGIVVADEQRSNLVERIEPLLSAYKLDSLASLAERIKDGLDDEIKSGVLDAISLSQSNWELSPEIKSVLHDYIFAQLPDNARLWVVGCAKGALAYSVAMEVAKYEHKTGNNKNFQLIATAASHSDINYAQLATYSKQQLSGLSDENSKSFVTWNDKANQGQIKDNIRQLLSFSQCDLTEDFQSLGAMDLIICPAVLVYFSNDIKVDIIKRFSGLLKSGSIFLTDNSQAIMSGGNGMERVNHPAGMFYRKKS